MAGRSIILNASLVNPSKRVIPNHTIILEDNPLWCDNPIPISVAATRKVESRLQKSTSFRVWLDSTRLGPVRVTRSDSESTWVSQVEDIFQISPNAYYILYEDFGTPWTNELATSCARSIKILLKCIHPTS
jgi:hypothetical protein